MGKEEKQGLLQSLAVDALLLTGSVHMRYLTGFTGEGYALLCGEQGRIVTDSRYTIAAREQCPDYEVCQWDREYYEPLFQVLREKAVKSLGIEDKVMTLSKYNKLKEELIKEGFGQCRLQGVSAELEKLRQVKNETERKKLRHAEAIGDRAFVRILPDLKPGMTEKQVAARLEYYMKEEGADGFSFDTIAASGIHSAMPHAVPTDKVLEDGDFLTMDFGCRYEGYCSDMTRTVVIGQADDRQREIYRTVLRAQETALAGIRPGMTGKEIDALGRDVIEKAGYGACFGHALGHSVGLEIHESPNFSRKSDDVILPGMVITVEPGIYVEGFGGVRIEDVVIITEDGCENITHSPKERIEITIGTRNRRNREVL